MNVHITNLHGIGGTCTLAQENVARIARELGMLEMGIYYYPVDTDTRQELNKRQDGILSSLKYGDIVIFQSPTWNRADYDLRLAEKIKGYRGVRLILWVHDVIPLMFDSGEENLRNAIEIYNLADLLILPSPKMHDTLKKRGLRTEKVLFQKVWDVTHTMTLPSPQYRQRMIFTGEPDRFSFLNSWQGSVPIDLFSAFPAGKEAESVRWHSRISMSELLLEQARGGFGLVWPQDSACGYYEMNQSYKFGTFLSSGIPVIVKKGTTAEELVRDQELGFVVDSMEEAAAVAASVTPADYKAQMERMRPFCDLIRTGWFTRMLLAEAVVQVSCRDKRI